MSEAFWFNREFDFVRLEGLSRATGRPPHEWDLYVVKELIDNALDADDDLWQGGLGPAPCIDVLVKYLPIAGTSKQEFEVRVSNRAAFPGEKVASIFATQRYTSRKAFVKGVTRGALGNALKTLLGIPYALRHRGTGDWNPSLRPLVIRCGRVEYRPRYLVDPTRQTITFDCEQRTTPSGVQGTEVWVGVDNFEQDPPRRQRTDLEHLAELYALCNPHAAFRWEVEMPGGAWQKAYEPQPGWASKFHGTPSVRWYSPATFQDLLGALHREEHGGCDSGELDVARVSRHFSEPAGGAMAEGWPHGGLSAVDIKGRKAGKLYEWLSARAPVFDPRSLGCIGADRLRGTLATMLPIEGEVRYQNAADVAETGLPFVIEAAAAFLKEGKRRLWPALNFTPTYDDPFVCRALAAPARPGELVVGLRGLLDAYGLTEEKPAVLFVHLICPAVEHTEFSKSGINHVPFKRVLADVLDGLLTGLMQAQEEERLRLEQTVFAALDAIVADLGEGERFVFEQLLEKLRVRLARDPALSAWLLRPDATARLQSHLAAYQGRNTALTHHVARVAAGTLAVPQHPDRHFSISTDHVTAELLARHHVNKVLYLQPRELEPVVLDNSWLCAFDAALLQNPDRPDRLREAWVQCALGCAVPLLVLHDADEAGRALPGQLRTWLRERGLDEGRLLDVGLDGPTPMRLAQMMPDEQAAWLMSRLTKLGVPLKSVPNGDVVRRDIREHFERMLLSHLWEGVSGLLEVPRLLQGLDSELHLTPRMMEAGLDQQLRDRLHEPPPTRSYAGVLDEVVTDFFKQFVEEHGAGMKKRVREHLRRVRGEGRP